MKTPVHRMIGRCVSISVSATLAAAGVVVLRHMLETPQPLKSQLPGEALLYIWQRRSIFYKVLGPADAPPLVLLHTPDIGASAREMQHLMEPLAQTYRVYAPDLLGFGLSDRPNVEYSAALYTALCQDFLRDVVKRPATLVASGLSCNYAVSVAASTPELCASLVLISPIALHGDKAQPFLLRKLAEKPLIKMLLYPMLSTRLAFLLTHGRQRASQSDFAQFYATTHQLGAEHAAMALLGSKLIADTAPQFETLCQPVLLIWGTQALEDQRSIACLRDTAALANQARQERGVELIQGAGLFVHQEQPESVIAAIRRRQAEALAVKAETRSQTIAATGQQAVKAKAAPDLAPTPQPQIETSYAAQTIPPDVSTNAAADLSRPTASQAAAPEEREEQKEEESEEIASNAPQARIIQAYCVKCKKKTEMRNASEFTMKNGRLAARGTCAICGSGITRIGGLG